MAETMMDYVEVKTDISESKYGYIVIYSSESSELMSITFIPKSKVALTLTKFELYDSGEEKSKTSQALKQKIHQIPVVYKISIPVGTSTKFYDACFLITADENLSFEVTKSIVVIFVDKDIKSLEPTEPYKPMVLPVQVNRPSRLIKLPDNIKGDLPDRNFMNVKFIVENHKIDDCLKDTRKSSLLKNCPVIFEDLTPQNYVKKLKLLVDLCLKAEYGNVNSMLNSYCKINFIREDKKTDIFEFEIYTDHLYVGALLYVQEIVDDIVSEDRYQGKVITLDPDVATLQFPKRFLQIFRPDKKFFLHYEPSNFNSSMMHKALDMVESENIKEVIFPKKINYVPENSLKLNLFNKQMEDNEEQKMAVQRILSKQEHRTPFILFGPPGTGKTTTVLEAIKQVYTLQEDSKILVCTPFNKHVDEITVELLEFIPKEDHKKTIHRCYASGYSPENIPSKIKHVTNLSTSQEKLKNNSYYKQYRMILATLMTAGRFTCLKGHFTHIFVDEAAFATEPETLVPLVGQINKNTRIVLAGDPKQLDPVFRSEPARSAGYDVTLIERLMEIHTKYKNTMVIKLLNNYRSHPAIIKIPNHLFYDNELKVCADEKKYSRFCSWPHLLQENFPVIFHDVFCEEVREKSDPSFFNLKEIQVVYSYVNKLLKTKGVTANDIGIIVTYKKQASKLTRYLELKSIKNVTVGTVEMFLSCEKEVIILSTVRSNLNDEEDSSVGFLKNPKRFNVALTRAKALEIVVGNAKVLQQVPCWESFITYCQENNSFIEDKDRKKKQEKNKKSKKKNCKI